MEKISVCIGASVASVEDLRVDRWLDWQAKLQGCGLAWVWNSWCLADQDGLFAPGILASSAGRMIQI